MIIWDGEGIGRKFVDIKTKLFSILALDIYLDKSINHFTFNNISNFMNLHA